MSPRVGIYRSDRQCRCFLAQCHLFATILRRNAPASASGSRIGGAQWHPDPSDMAKGPTVKNGKEAYLACLTRCARGLRCRKCGGAAAATDSRNCAPCAATSSPGRSREDERIWSEHRAKESL